MNIWRQGSSSSNDRLHISSQSHLQLLENNPVQDGCVETLGDPITSITIAKVEEFLEELASVTLVVTKVLKMYAIVLLHVMSY